VLWRDKLSRKYFLKQGVRQGAVLSPILYALFINELVEELEQVGGGYRMSEELNISVLLFADDLLLLASTTEQLQAMLVALLKFANRWGFEVNVDKTKAMILNGTRKLTTPSRSMALLSRW
jgi:hypothetical protein